MSAKRSPSLGLLTAMTVASLPHESRGRATDAYHRPGGHSSAKASARANRRRKMVKATKKAQRRSRR